MFDPDFVRTLDCDRILGGKRPKQGGIWQGNVDSARQAKRAGFDVVIMTALEAQPSEAAVAALAPVQVIAHPFDDCELSPSHFKKADALARRVAGLVHSGKRVLVTCYAGWNRSGLVTALACHHLTGLPGSVIVNRMRLKRKNALSNDSFAAAIRSLPAHPIKPHLLYSPAELQGLYV